MEKSSIDFLVMGLVSLSFPFLWHVRRHSVSYTWPYVASLRWCYRGIGVLLLLWASLSRVFSMEINPLSLGSGGAALIILSDPIARFSAGPAAMDVETDKLKRYWVRSVGIGIAYIISALIFVQVS